MKNLKLLIGIAAVITALYSAPRPRALKPFHSFEQAQRMQMSVDSMEFENKMSVWSK